MASKIVKTEKMKKKYTQAEKDQMPHSCVKCGTKNKEYFNKSRNPAHLTGKQLYCKVCLVEFFSKYKRAYKDDYRKIFWYLCRKIDMGYSNSAIIGVYTMLDSAKARDEKVESTAIIGEYMKLCNSFGDTQGYPVCFDDSDMLEGLTQVEEEVLFEEDEDDIEITPELVRTWGNLPQKDIRFLEYEYRDWCSRHIVDTKALEICVREICYIHLKIQQAKETGASTSALLKDLQAVMTTASLKPNMEVNADSIDGNTIGMWIKKFEEDRPIPEPQDEFKDPDKVLYFVKNFFLGHFCKMQGIENEMSAEYENEMAKYSVDLGGEDF